MFQLKLLKRFAFICLFAPGTLWAAPDKIALIVGNSDYEATGSLRNPQNDAMAMARKLEGLGFETFEGYNLDLDGMYDLLDTFSLNVEDAEVALLYYAGHGISVDGVNYLLPTDARLDNAIRWKRSVLSLDEIAETLGLSRGANLMFIDACRDNPMADQLSQVMASNSRSVSMTRGLSRTEYTKTGGGTLIAFATEAGNVASDGDGEHSPFTTALLNNIDAENESIGDVMTKVTSEVKAATSGQQEPWVTSSLTEVLELNPVPVSAVVDDGNAKFAVIEPTDTAPSALDPAEKAFYEAVEDSNDIADLESYLELYPNGVFVPLVKNAIARLEAAPQQQTAPFQSPGVTPVSATQGFAPQGALTSLPVTQAVLTAPANQGTEQILDLNIEARKDLQRRLSALGHNTHGVDGQLGPNSRRAIANWQTANGLGPTQYLNAHQYEMLVVASEPVLENWTATHSQASSGYGSGGSRAGTSGGRGTSVNSSVVGAAVAGFLAGTILRGRR